MEEQVYRILVVDGNRVSRRVYSKLLLNHFEEQCKIEEAESGANGLYLCTRDPIDCILLDDNLPDLQVLDFIHMLKHHHNKHLIPVVILTDEGDEMMAVEAMKSGAQDYLVKGSFSHNLLGQAILNAIEKVELQKQLEQKQQDLETTNAELINTNAQLKEAQQQLIDAAHKAGMAEIATSVLHNIGNILNSVNTSVECLGNIIDRSKLKGLNKANTLLKSYEEVLSEQPKGPQLIAYYEQLDEQRELESGLLKNELENVIDKINMIRANVTSQKRYANTEFHTEEINLANLVDDALKMQEEHFEEHSISLSKDYSELPRCKGVRVKLVNAISSILKNSIDSMSEAPQPKECQLAVRIYQSSSSQASISITDNGVGILYDQLTKIFNYGFTTKPGATGIGLHMAANAMTEMHGQITVESEGTGKGASFTLSLPLSNEK